MTLIDFDYYSRVGRIELTNQKWSKDKLNVLARACYYLLVEMKCCSSRDCAECCSTDSAGKSVEFLHRNIDIIAAEDQRSCKNGCESHRFCNCAAGAS